MKMLTGITASSIDMHAALASGEVKEDGKGQFQFDPKSEVTRQLGGATVDIHGLIKAAAKHYHLSDDPKDYLVVPVPILISDVPNRNGVAFPAKELAAFSPDMGCCHYQTWRGKPTFSEHANDDITAAKGIILDVTMNKVKEHPGFYKVVELLSFDRTKDKKLFAEVASNRANAYSMGAYVNHYRCSICAHVWEPGDDPQCSHIAGGKRPTFARLHDGRLAYRQAIGVTGFETSLVATPAWRMAHSDFVNVIDPEIRATPR